MEPLIDDLVKEAKVALQTPFDAVHGERHHLAVWENCQWIVDNENISNLDMAALEVAAWWHDVQRGQEDETSILKGLFKDRGINPKFQEKVLTIIEGHSFGSNQSSVEQQILFDADKSEYVSVGTMNILVESYKLNLIDEARFKYYEEKWRELILAVRNQIHYDSAKEEFENRLKNIVSQVQKDETLRAFVEGIML